ncbi:hypothetical protein [Ascidiimonas aurantiaca]|uniref:hypothetical protein n=1 Tax=Ascidiimonas aurantiaca TaxID=1685432 RepID=UPI0030EEB756
MLPKKEKLCRNKLPNYVFQGEAVFEKENTDKRSGAEKEEQTILSTLGQLKVEDDFLKGILR